MSWKKLLAARHVAAEPSSKQELDELRRKVTLSLKDAQVSAVSAQGRFEFAYNAARLMATVVVRACGYRVTGKTGHHYFTFQALEATDSVFARAVANFDAARSKRNDFSYDEPTEISDTDASDLVAAVKEFQVEAEKWIAAKHPAFS